MQLKTVCIAHTYIRVSDWASKQASEQVKLSILEFPCNQMHTKHTRRTQMNFVVIRFAMFRTINTGLESGCVYVCEFIMIVSFYSIALEYTCMCVHHNSQRILTWIMPHTISTIYMYCISDYVTARKNVRPIKKTLKSRKHTKQKVAWNKRNKVVNLMYRRKCKERASNLINMNAFSLLKYYIDRRRTRKILCIHRKW